MQLVINNTWEVENQTLMLTVFIEAYVTFSTLEILVHHAHVVNYQTV